MAVLRADDTGDVSREQLLELTEGDTEFAQELIAVFLGDAPERLAEIETGLETGDDVLVARAAHTLKGAVGHFSLGAVYATTRDLEEMARSGDLAATALAYPATKTRVEKLLVDLQTLASSL